MNAFDANANDTVYTIIFPSNGGLYVGGKFGTIGGQSRNGLAALDTTTALATAWAPEPDSIGVTAIAASGQTVYVGGSFSTIGGQARPYVAALDATTGLATAWAPQLDSSP